MSWSKKATVMYHFIDSANDNYFKELQLSFDALLKSEDSSGTFDAGESHFFWKINSTVNIVETTTYFVSVVKEKNDWPVWFTEDNGIGEIPLNNGALGELFYAIINPESRFILSLAANGGGPISVFKKFLNEFSKNENIKLTPLFEDNIDVLTLAWDHYKKLSISLNFPSYDYQSEFITTKEGSLLTAIDELGGLKADITISAPKQKQKLNLSQAKDFVKALLVNDFCSKLVVKGSDSEGEEILEYDLKNAQVKYKEMIEISGSYMTEDEALPILKRAFNEKSHDLVHLTE